MISSGPKNDLHRFYVNLYRAHLDYVKVFRNCSKKREDESNFFTFSYLVWNEKPNFKRHLFSSKISRYRGSSISWKTKKTQPLKKVPTPEIKKTGLWPFGARTFNYSYQWVYQNLEKLNVFVQKTGKRREI